MKAVFGSGTKTNELVTFIKDEIASRREWSERQKTKVKMQNDEEQSVISGQLMTEG